MILLGGVLLITSDTPLFYRFVSIISMMRIVIVIYYFA